MSFDLTYDPIVGTGLPAEPGTQVLGAAIEARWIAATTSNYDGRTLQVAFTGGQAVRARREAERWLVDMAPLVGLQLLEVDGRVWRHGRGWRPINDPHPDMYLEQTAVAGALLTAVIEPTGTLVTHVLDSATEGTPGRRPHWRVYSDGVLLPVNGARPPRAFPTILVANPVVAAEPADGGVLLILQDGATPMVPVGWSPTPQPVVVVNQGPPPNQSIPAPPTQGVGP